MNELTLAYLAGAMDSDGSIGVRRSTYAMRIRGDASVPIYSERILFKQVTPDVPTLLRDTFGGTLRLDLAQGVNRRRLYSWQVTDRKATAVLVALRPYLRVKGAQANNALALRELKEESRRLRTLPGRGHVGGGVRPSALNVAMEACYQRAKELNRVGVAA